MAEETAVVTQPVIEERPSVEVKTNAFSKDAWSETAPEPAKVEDKKIEDKVAEVAKVEELEEILDPKEWLKREFEVEDVAIIKAEREELKKLKSQPAQEYKFENEDSKRLASAIAKGDRKTVLEILGTQERLDTFTTAEVTKDTAPEIIKLGMQLSNKLLTKDEIDFQYKQDYGYPKEPKKPEQKVTESDEDFQERLLDYNERHEEWNQQVTNIDMRKVVAAKMAIPQLEQLKSKIVLPELEKPKSEMQQPSQESLAALAKIRENFLTQLESNFSKVNGFETRVKDDSVDIPISYKIPDDAKNAIKARLTQDFDVENYIGDRWFDDKGSPKIEQIITDIFELENRDKIHEGIAREAATKRLDEYIKSAKNISIGKTPQKTFDPEQQNGAKTKSPFAKDAWSETAPIHQN